MFYLSLLSGRKFLEVFIVFFFPSDKVSLNVICIVLSTRMNDFAGADDHYDMWVFDEYTSNERVSNGEVEYSEAAST